MLKKSLRKCKALNFRNTSLFSECTSKLLANIATDCLVCEFVGILQAFYVDCRLDKSHHLEQDIFNVRSSEKLGLII